ncbi:MAG: Glycosyl transferase, group 1 [Candidatus Gottesmanbacteria bacterium GW2011_GWC2_39_8]|uniref:Glycosyl transferase, group 1 n=1 Tax=Candidatus Gottesmanbacteria bacterium GW2011_GWC2_39_8 TaxID=1618450 RepID=A0A0G0SEV1_9BACT|nr:MAG: Glycosyl transferase, group 1 [Candidatus Gottesmanbacteria bacterium GW2011_GWC2_39_8]
MNKVLIITTHFPPDRHVGAKRPAKFVKFLPEFGWQSVVLTMGEEHYHGIDDSLSENLSGCVSIFRPKKWHVFGAMTLGRKNSKSKLNHRTAWKGIPLVKRFFVRLMLFDFGWILSACVRGAKIVKNEEIDILFSTSPNPEAHLVGLCLKIVTGRPWIADFRDPWTALDIFYTPGYFKRGIDRLCEKIVVTTADHITAISRTLAKNLNKLRNCRNKNNVSVVYNGYDKDDFDEVDDTASSAHPFTITYLGTWGTGRSPESFLRAMGKLLIQCPNIKKQIRVNFVGEVKFDQQMHALIEQVILEENLNGVVNMIPFLPYKRGLNLLMHSDVSLLVVSLFHSRVGCLSSKLFEYMNAGKPILALAPFESEEAQIILAAGAGQVVAPEEVNAISNKIKEMYMNFQNGCLSNGADAYVTEKFERKKQTSKLAAIFNDLLVNANSGEKRRRTLPLC